jgi:hypothetical protein
LLNQGKVVVFDSLLCVLAWLDHLLPCPCTLTQAVADWGRWQPDVSCSMYTGSVCFYHKNAKHCVRTVNPS